VNVRILKDEQAVARAVAARVITTLTAKPATALGLPTGRTPVELYARLVAAYMAGRIDFAQATTFNLDEFLGLPSDHPASYRAFMEAHLFAHVNLSPRRIHFFNGVALDPVAECVRYETAIRRAGGIDLLLLGIGANGHIGFNEPAAGLVGDSHVARLAPGTRRSNAHLFGGRVQAVPPSALSMGVGTILRSRAIVLVATGAGKADVIRATVEGPVTTRLPASLLQLHGAVDLVADEAAAAGLRRR
jgi:glucosamine-6-phosphate deaminase